MELTDAAEGRGPDTAPQITWAQVMTWEQLRQQGAQMAPGMEHLWVAAPMYILTNPEPERITLNPENLIGCTPITCLYCANLFNPVLRERKCAQNKAPGWI